MPAGRTHDQITLISLPFVAGLMLLLSRNSRLTLIACAGFLFSGLMFGPDLDIVSCQFKRWGPLRCIWLPYQKSLRHRSFWSHAPLIGTTLRLAYLGLWLGLVTGLVTMVLYYGWRISWSWTDTYTTLGNLAKQYPGEGLVLYMGLELGAISHSLSDWGSSAYKRLRSRRRRQAAKSRCR